MPYHVALKCTYNNGRAGHYIGFAGTCSNDIIKHNVDITQRVNCNASACRDYLHNGCKGPRPVKPCYESEMFVKWRFGAGWYHTGVKANTPIHMAQAGIGNLAILTTRFPDNDEAARRIVGLFKIGSIEKGGAESETILIADETGRVRLTREEADNAFYWDFQSNQAVPRWDTGLFRYLTDGDVAKLLTGLRVVAREDQTKIVIDGLLEGIPYDHSPHKQHDTSVNDNPIVKKVLLHRKYGSGGEGPEHKN